MPFKLPAIESPLTGDEKPIAYLLGVEIENILCFKEKQYLKLSNEQDFPYQWTVIFGENGVGKSTLLRCIAMGRMSQESIVGRKINDDFEYEPMVFNHQDYHSIYDWESFYGELFGGENSFNLTVAPNQKLLEFQKKREYKKISIKVDSMSTLSGEYTHPALFGLIMYGYGASRRVGEPNFTEYTQDDDCGSLFSENVALINFEEWLLQMDYSLKYSSAEDRKKTEDKIQNIKKVLQKLFSDEITDFRITLDKDFGNKPRVQLKNSYGWVKFPSLSFGYKTMIVWILDLIIRLYERYPDSLEPLSEPAIVLIDEIDLHLHPKWQRRIKQFLIEYFPNTQFIVTAHSPLVVQAAHDANIVLLRREGDRVIIDNNPQMISNWRVDQVLTSLFEIPSARPPELDKKLERREEILGKAELTEEDEAELKTIREEIGNMPTGDNPNDIHAMDIIRRAAQILEQKEQEQ